MKIKIAAIAAFLVSMLITSKLMQEKDKTLKNDQKETMEQGSDQDNAKLDQKSQTEQEAAALAKKTAQAETPKKVPHRFSNPIKIAGGVKLFLSNTFQAVPETEFNWNWGKVKERKKGYVAFKPKNKAIKKLPVVFNSLHQEVGYLTGTVTIFYNNIREKEGLISALVDEYGNSLELVDEKLKLVNIRYPSIEKLRDILSFREDAEVNIVYTKRRRRSLSYY